MLQNLIDLLVVAGIEVDAGSINEETNHVTDAETLGVMLADLIRVSPPRVTIESSSNCLSIQDNRFVDSARVDIDDDSEIAMSQAAGYAEAAGYSFRWHASQSGLRVWVNSR